MEEGRSPLADRTEVEMAQGPNSREVRMNLEAVLVQMIDCSKVDKMVWVRDLGSMGARRCLASELVQMIDCPVADRRTEVDLVQGLHSNPRVARRMTQAQDSDWWVAEVIAEVDRQTELEQRELSKNLDFPHGLEVLRRVGSPLMTALSLEQRMKSLMEGNVQPQLQG